MKLLKGSLSLTENGLASLSRSRHSIGSYHVTRSAAAAITHIKMMINNPAAANGCLFVNVREADNILTASGGVVSVLSTNSLDIGFLAYYWYLTRGSNHPYEMSITRFTNITAIAKKSTID